MEHSVQEQRPSAMTDDIELVTYLQRTCISQLSASDTIKELGSLTATKQQLSAFEPSQPKETYGEVCFDADLQNDMLIDKGRRI